MKKRQHQLVITISFDRPCTKAHAIDSARQCIHGELFPYAFNDGDPETMTVRGFRQLRAERKSDVRSV